MTSCESCTVGHFALRSSLYINKLHMTGTCRRGEREKKRVRGPISINRPLPLLVHVQDITCFLGVQKKPKTLKPYYFDFTHGRTETHMRKRGPCARLRSSPKQTELHAVQGLLRKKSSWGQLEKNNNRKTQWSGKNERQRKSQALMKCFDSMQVLWSCPSICSQSFGVVMFLSTVDK